VDTEAPEEYAPETFDIARVETWLAKTGVNSILNALIALRSSKALVR